MYTYINIDILYAGIFIQIILYALMSMHTNSPSHHYSCQELMMISFKKQDVHEWNILFSFFLLETKKKNRRILSKELYRARPILIRSSSMTQRQGGGWGSEGIGGKLVAVNGYTKPQCKECVYCASCISNQFEFSFI